MTNYLVIAPRREAYELECEQYNIDPDDARITVLYTQQDFAQTAAFPSNTMWNSVDEPDVLLLNAMRIRFPSTNVRFCDIVADMRLAPDPGYAINPKKIIS